MRSDRKWTIHSNLNLLATAATLRVQPRLHIRRPGTAERVAALVKDRTAPIPLAATTVDFGLPAALWIAAQQSGVFALLESLWPPPRSGPSTAHYLLLAAIQRVCQPGPKTDVAAWHRRTILHAVWGFPPERFTSQAFWDCFDQIQASGSGQDDLDRAQLRLLGLWKDKQLARQRLLACDSTSFYTNRMDRTAEQVVGGYDGQQHIEKVFRGLKDGDWLGWVPMYHWTDDKIRMHAFYCMLGISPLQYIHQQVQALWPGLSTGQLIEQLEQIQQFTLRRPLPSKAWPTPSARLSGSKLPLAGGLATFVFLWRPNRVHLRYGSRVRLPARLSHRWNSRSFGYLLNRQFTW